MRSFIVFVLSSLTNATSQHDDVCLGTDLPQWFCHIGRAGTGKSDQHGLKLPYTPAALEAAYNVWLTKEHMVGTVRERQTGLKMNADIKPASESLLMEWNGYGGQPAALRAWVENSTATELTRVAQQCNHHPNWGLVFFSAETFETLPSVQFSETLQWKIVVCSPVAWGYVDMSGQRDYDMDILDSLLRIGIVNDLIEHVADELSTPAVDWFALRKTAPLPEAHFAEIKSFQCESEFALSLFHVAIEEHAKNELGLVRRNDVKVAACISGGVRDFVNEQVYSSLQKLIRNLEADVRTFFVLDLNKQTKFHGYGSGPSGLYTLEELNNAFAAVPATVFHQFQRPNNIKRHPSCLVDQYNCGIIAMQLETCTNLISNYERENNMDFEFVLRLRPDLHHRGDIGPIWRYDPNTIHMPSCRDWACCCDRYAVVPRRFWQLYIRGYRDQENEFICGNDTKLESLGIPPGSTHCGCLVWSYLNHAAGGRYAPLLNPPIALPCGGAIGKKLKGSAFNHRTALGEIAAATISDRAVLD